MNAHRTYPAWIAGKAVQPNSDLIVRNPYSDELVGAVPLCNAQDMERAIASAHKARQTMAALPAYVRRDILQQCVRSFEHQRETLAEVVCAETGKPIGDCRGEVTRLIETVQVAAEESTRMHGEVLEMQVSARTEGVRGMWKRVPVGPVGLISPFNFPLNLVAHKIAPAIAAGCPFVLKPSDRTPISASLLGEILAQTDLPSDAWFIVPCSIEVADALVRDDRLALLSFTGSSEVGWDLKKRAGKKKVVLELGGNAACLVDKDADIADAVGRITTGAFYQSGQSCISVQRIFVHADIYEDFRDLLVAKTSSLVCGDPRDERTFVGPVIDDPAADRLMTWIHKALENGARLLCGGTRENRLIYPTLLEQVPPSLPISSEEAFGPLAILNRFRDDDAVLAEINASRFGLQVGLFTSDIHKAMRAWDDMEVGGVIINDVPSFRVDHMPYGGRKDSGLGREGIRWAMEEMTEPRLLVIRDKRS